MSTEMLAHAGVRPWLVVVMILSAVGIADSGYLLLKHRRSMPLATISGGRALCPTNGCDAVTQGEYAEVAGVPLATFGLVGYLTLFGLSVLALGVGGRGSVRAIVMLSGVGAGVSGYLIYLQIAVIKVICSWCMVSAVTMLSIFVLSLAALHRVGLPGEGMAVRVDGT